MKNLYKNVASSKEIGEIIRQARKQVKMKQAEAAGLCGVGTRFFSELENGKNTLHIGKVLDVLKKFGLIVGIKKRETNDE